jgi:NAD(P)-dependent dehydrogenase (short-subunit alcohol dehydrogenase family)
MAQVKHKGIIIITGASSGIGNSTARYLAERGYFVYGGVRKTSDATALRETAPDSLQPLMLDVTKQDQIDAAAARVQQEVQTPGLIVLINNAGITTSGPVEFLPVDELRSLWEVNVTGVVAVTQAFMPLIRAANTGHIINISSFGGSIASPFLAPYHASKFALEAISDSLRMELSPWPNIHVSVVKPASIKTPIWQKAVDDFDSLFERLKPGAREYYDQALRTVTQSRIDFDERGEEPIVVARAIHKIITMSSPPARRLVAFNPVVFVLLRLLPDRWRDRLVRRSVGLK